MAWLILTKHCSSARMARYETQRKGDTAKAAADYGHNLLLAEAMHPVLHMLEISLRNAVHAQLAAHYGRQDWWEAWVGNSEFTRAYGKVQDVIRTLQTRKERHSVDKVVAELTFGFWTSCFNAAHSRSLWPTLRYAFPHCPKAKRQRPVVAGLLNHARDLRNRISHHEGVLWLTPRLDLHHQQAVELLCWLDPALATWVHSHDRLPATWAAWSAT